jgi:quercetin dioxygenase-like cupin family protein
MKQYITSVIALVILFLAVPGRSRADEYTNIKVEKILVSATAYNGQQMSYLRTNQPEVTAVVVTIPPGGATGWHQHPVPVYAYMLDGELTVELKDGNSYRFKKGEVILEVVNLPHNGMNNGDKDARLMVFYTGAIGLPNVIRQDTANH